MSKKLFGVSRRGFFSYSKVQGAVAFLVRNRRIQLGRGGVKGKSYIDIGCGWNTHPHMINIDFQWHPGIDLCWDVSRKGLPFPDRSIKGIFSEHCLEHHSPEMIQRLLAECYRVLQPGGRIRLVLPDAEKYINTYFNIISGENSDGFPYPEDILWRGIKSPLLGVNRVFYQDRDSPYGHCFMFDRHLLHQFIEQQGFKNIESRDFRQGHDPSLLLDSEDRWIESFAMEAERS